MGCNNSHFSPLFRRCRKRRTKKDEERQKNGELIEANHVESSNHDLLQGFQFLGSSVRNPSIKQGIPSESSNNESPFCVPLLAQSEASSSQIDFFKMLDQKIEDGPNYDPQLDGDLHQKECLEIWKRGIEICSWERQSSEKLTRCQWDEDGD